MPRHPRALPAVRAILLSCLFAAPALAAWPHDPDVNVRLSTSSGTHQDLVSCPDEAGGAIAAWSDAHAGNYNIYAQRVDARGNVAWAVGGVDVCAATGTQTYPVMCPDGAGGVILAWNDSRSGTTDIYVQRVNADGVSQWSKDGVALCTATGSQGYPAICTDGSGGAIVAWWDTRTSGTGDVYAQRVDGAGAVQWTANGIVVCNATAAQSDARLVADGSGGAIVAWRDNRSANYDVYAQRINSSGTALWTANGNAVCTEGTSQTNMEMTSDGLGGAILAWTTSGQIYAQRMDAPGAARWTANGVRASVSATAKNNACIDSDGDGGAVIGWSEYNGADDDIYAQRMRSNGALLWNTAGVAVCASPEDQEEPYLVADGAHGAVLAWSSYSGSAVDVYARRVDASGNALWTAGGVPLCTNRVNIGEMALVSDQRNGAVAAWGGLHDGADGIYAQHVDRYGEIGSPAPTITALRDAANDQGGQLVVEWTGSYLDADPGYAIDSYSIWRQVPSSLAQARAQGRRALRATVEGARTVYWECVGSQPARAREGYSFVAPTTTDSMAGSNPLTRFMVSAEEPGGTPFWDSAPDSGYSVDNLAPPMPAPFTGTFSGAAAYLQWGASPAGDFAAFELYRGASADFVPGPGSLVATTTAGGWTDPAPALHYKLRALDVHGNGSPYAALYLAGALEAPGAGVPREVFLAAPLPNPARARAALRFGLPQEARVTLELLDAQGRRVRTLRDGALPAGEHAVTWDGTDDAGRPLAAGLYLCRLQTGGRALTRRLVVVR